VPHAEDVVSRAPSLVAREHELERALHSLRFSGGVLITGEPGAGKTFLAARWPTGCRNRRSPG
jgi:MoxR-like ATPase